MSSFFERLNALTKKYGHIIKSDTDDGKDLLGNLIESWEDLALLEPELRALVKCELTDDEFRQALNRLHGRLWHTIEHLSGLDSDIAKLWHADDADEQSS